jgi:hypothetical protein
MSTKHTPGPWTTNGDWIKQPGIDGFSIAHLIGHKEKQANARLIASAPELLETLRHASGVLNEVISTHRAKLDPKYLTPKEVSDCLIEIGKAIAKAEGGDS